MDIQIFAQWFDSLSTPERISALSKVYSRLTVHARELFITEWVAGKEQRVQEILQGLNEIHHILANQLMAYSKNEQKAPSIQSLGKMLLEIEVKYHLEKYLTPAVEFARTQTASSPLTVYPDGRIVDGNIRVRVLMDRNVDVDSLPRVERIPGI